VQGQRCGHAASSAASGSGLRVAAGNFRCPVTLQQCQDGRAPLFSKLGIRLLVFPPQSIPVCPQSARHLGNLAERSFQRHTVPACRVQLGKQAANCGDAAKSAPRASRTAYSERSEASTRSISRFKILVWLQTP